jgi:hypothetical protein
MTTDKGNGGSNSQPDTVTTSVPAGYYPGVGYIPVTVSGTQDNVWKASTPTLLAAQPGEAGAKTEWDVTSLDEAVRWLTAHADYLARMYHGMDDIKALMDGPEADTEAGLQRSSPLGGFDWATKLAAKHTGLYQGVNQSLKQVVESLYDAADAVKKVKENYHDVEHASSMSASDLESVFTDVSQGDHDF